MKFGTLTEMAVQYGDFRVTQLKMSLCFPNASSDRNDITAGSARLAKSDAAVTQTGHVWTRK